MKWNEVAQLWLTLWDPMDSSLPGFLVHWIFQARVLEWAAMILEASKALFSVFNMVQNFHLIWITYVHFAFHFLSKNGNLRDNNVHRREHGIIPASPIPQNHTNIIKIWKSINLMNIILLT